MQIQSPVKVVPNEKAGAPSAQQQQQPTPGEPPSQQDSYQKSFMNSMASPEVTNKLLSQVKAKNSLTINPTDEGGMTVTNTGPTAFESALDTIGTRGSKLLSNASQEVVRVMNASPSATFLASAKAAREGIEGLVPRNSMGEVDKLIMPALRGVMLITDTKRAMSTFKNKDASGFEKAVDGLHVATDVVGLAGELGKVGVLPFLDAGLSQSLATAGFVGDFVAVAFHAMGYLTERGQVNSEFTGNMTQLNSIFSSSAARAAEERALRAEKAAAKASA